MGGEAEIVVGTEGDKGLTLDTRVGLGRSRARRTEACAADGFQCGELTMHLFFKRREHKGNHRNGPVGVSILWCQSSLDEGTMFHVEQNAPIQRVRPEPLVYRTEFTSRIPGFSGCQGWLAKTKTRPPSRASARPMPIHSSGGKVAREAQTSKDCPCSSSHRHRRILAWRNPSS